MLPMFWLLIIGLIAGLLARAIVPGKNSMGWLATIVVGVTASVVGGLLLGLLTGGLRDRGFGPAGLIGAVIVLIVYNRLAVRRSIVRDTGPGRA